MCWEVPHGSEFSEEKVCGFLRDRAFNFLLNAAVHTSLILNLTVCSSLMSCMIVWG